MANVCFQGNLKAAEHLKWGALPPGSIGSVGDF
jgi:hypothetical protein